MSKNRIDIEEFIEVVGNYSQGNYNARLTEVDDDYFNTLISGINLIGEELESTTISRDFFSNVYNAISEMMWVFDNNFQIQAVNQSAISTLGWGHEYFLLNGISQFISNSKLKKLKIKLERSKVFRFSGTFKSIRNQQVPVNAIISRIRNRFGDPLGYLVLAKDITDEKEQELNLLNAVVSAQEEEKKRLSYDLHDSLGQELNAIKMYADTLNKIGNLDENASKILIDLQDLVDNSIISARRISYDLMPAVLEKGTLTEAVEYLISTLKMDNVKFDLKIYTNSANLSKQIQVFTYRIIQEFLNNSLKHAGANKISIIIREKSPNLSLTISDNGKGFDISTVKKGKGIHSIEFRLKALNAIYNFSTSKGYGTSLNAQIPI